MFWWKADDLDTDGQGLLLGPFKKVYVPVAVSLFAMKFYTFWNGNFKTLDQNLFKQT